MGTIQIQVTTDTYNVTVTHPWGETQTYNYRYRGVATRTVRRWQAQGYRLEL